MWPDAPALYVPSQDALPRFSSDDGDGGGSSTNPADPPDIQQRRQDASDALQNAFASNRQTHQSQIATVDADYDTAVAAAGALHQQQTQAAHAAYQNDLNGFVPADTQAAIDAIDEANDAYVTARDATIATASEEHYRLDMESLDDKYDRDGAAQDQFNTDSEAVYRQAEDDSQPHYDEMSDAYYDYQNGEITESQMQSRVDAAQAAADAIWDQVRIDISDLQEVLDDALIDSQATADTESAAHSKAYVTATADAGKAEHDILLSKQEELSVLQSNSHYDSELNTADAAKTLAEASADAAKAYHDAYADAKQAQRDGKLQADAQLTKSNRAASSAYSATMSGLDYEAVQRRYAGDSSAAAAYQVQAAAQQRTLSDAVRNAQRTNDDKQTDADLALDLAISAATAVQDKADAQAGQIESKEIATQVESFKNNYLTTAKANAEATAGFNESAARKHRDAAAAFDNSMASVQKDRTTRDADELKDVRKAQAKLSNHYQAGRIEEAAYQSQSAALAETAAAIRTTIAKETFGDPSGGGAGGGESGSRTGRFDTLTGANQSRASESTGQTASFDSSHAGWLAGMRSGITGARSGRTAAARTAADAYHTAVESAMPPRPRRLIRPKCQPPNKRSPKIGPRRFRTATSRRRQLSPVSKRPRRERLMGW